MKFAHCRAKIICGRSARLHNEMGDFRNRKRTFARSRRPVDDQQVILGGPLKSLVGSGESFHGDDGFDSSVKPDPTWPDIVDAADWLRHDLGVSKVLWGDACLTMGRELAAVALAIVSTKDEEHFRTSPGGYFHGMVDKAKAGVLHLDRSVWALRRSAQPIPARRSGSGAGL